MSGDPQLYSGTPHDNQLLRRTSQPVLAFIVLTPFGSESTGTRLRPSPIKWMSGLESVVENLTSTVSLLPLCFSLKPTNHVPTSLPLTHFSAIMAKLTNDAPDDYNDPSFDMWVKYWEDVTAKFQVSRASEFNTEANLTGCNRALRRGHHYPALLLGLGTGRHSFHTPSRVLQAVADVAPPQ